MQDRLPPARRNPLATHGRTIHWVKLRKLAKSKCLPLCHQHQTFVRNAASRLNLRCQARCSSNKLRVDRAPSMPVGDNECRDPERLGQAKRLLELRVGWAYRLEISSSLCCQAHEKNAA